MKKLIISLIVSVISGSVFAQNFGIDQPSPAEKLDVIGNIKASGIVYWGNGATRTETRDDAGQMGTRSGFYETSVPSPATDWPTGASSWWHLIDIRHSNTGNNYAMQFAGSFFDQDVWFRKTNNNGAQPWKKIAFVTGSGAPVIYNYTGGDQSYTVPAGVTSITVKIWGAGGGGGYFGGWGSGFSGGAGGFTKGNIAVSPGQVLTVMVGAGGTGGHIANNSNNYGGGSRSCNGGTDCRYGGQGGGRSAIRNGGTELMTAGGGGGGGASRNGSLANYGGAGGGIEGEAGTSDQYNFAHGMGGNQSAGGAGACCQTNNGFAGSQFLGGLNASQAYGGSGGGGWFGGGGGGYQESNTMGGGGGGSGYIGGAGVSSAFTIKGNLSEPPYMDDANYVQGIGRGGLTNVTSTPLQGGNGMVVITPN